MRKPIAAVVALIAVVALAVFWMRNRQTLRDVGRELEDAAREAGKTADEITDDLKNAAREAGKAADAASEAVEEFKSAVESPPDRPA